MGDEVLGRSRAYEALAGALHEGITPALAGVLGADGQDAEALAAEHYRVLGLNVYPYAGVFLSGDGLMGGVEADACQAFYASVGWEVPNQQPDHLGVQLGALGWLAGAEADALFDGAGGQAARVRGLRRRFLDERVLTWLPTFARAVTWQGEGVMADLARLALELAVTDRQALGDDLMGGFGAPLALPSPPDLMADPKTTLRDIAHYLTTTAWAGLYLSRDDIARWAQRHAVPTGFTDRQTLLHNVLRSAVAYGRFAPLMDDLRALAEDWAGYYEAGTWPWREVWAARARQTATMLREVRDGALSG